jgi:hypothetical protein
MLLGSLNNIFIIECLNDATLRLILQKFPIAELKKSLYKYLDQGCPFRVVDDRNRYCELFRRLLM